MRMFKALLLIFILIFTVTSFTACKKKPKETDPVYIDQIDSEGYPIPPVEGQPGLSDDMINAGGIPEPPAESRLPEGLEEGFVEEALPVIYFDFDSYDLKTSEMEKIDRIVVPYIKQNATAHIQIEGHCDERGTEEYNLNLGQKRASAVRDFLISRGINDAVLHTISYGEERPVDPGQSEAAYTANRRVQFLIYFTE